MLIPHSIKRFFISGKTYEVIFYFDGYCLWTYNGLNHREDGPARYYYGESVYFNFKYWYLDDNLYSQKDWFSELLNRNLTNEAL